MPQELQTSILLGNSPTLYEEQMGKVGQVGLQEEGLGGNKDNLNISPILPTTNQVAICQ